MEGIVPIRLYSHPLAWLQPLPVEKSGVLRGEGSHVSLSARFAAQLEVSPRKEWVDRRRSGGGPRAAGARADEDALAVQAERRAVFRVVREQPTPPHCKSGGLIVQQKSWRSRLPEAHVSKRDDAKRACLREAHQFAVGTRVCRAREEREERKDVLEHS